MTHTIDSKGYMVEGKAGRMPYSTAKKKKSTSMKSSSSKSSSSKSSSKDSSKKATTNPKKSTTKGKWVMDSSGKWKKVS